MKEFDINILMTELVSSVSYSQQKYQMDIRLSRVFDIGDPRYQTFDIGDIPDILIQNNNIDLTIPEHKQKLIKSVIAMLQNSIEND